MAAHEDYREKHTILELWVTDAEQTLVACQAYPTDTEFAIQEKLAMCEVGIVSNWVGEISIRKEYKN